MIASHSYRQLLGISPIGSQYLMGSCLKTELSVLLPQHQWHRAATRFDLTMRGPTGLGETFVPWWRGVNVLFSSSLSTVRTPQRLKPKTSLAWKAAGRFDVRRCDSNHHSHHSNSLRGISQQQLTGFNTSFTYNYTYTRTSLGVVEKGSTVNTVPDRSCLGVEFEKAWKSNLFVIGDQNL